MAALAARPEATGEVRSPATRSARRAEMPITPRNDASVSARPGAAPASFSNSISEAETPNEVRLLRLEAEAIRRNARSRSRALRFGSGFEAASAEASEQPRRRVRQAEHVKRHEQDNVGHAPSASGAPTDGAFGKAQDRQNSAEERPVKIISVPIVRLAAAPSRSTTAVLAETDSAQVPPSPMISQAAK